ncbi:MAG: sugar transferase, partial [Actinomycetota bacterium]|nr:sugar transferase [Actinomycetota bacterium]
MEAIDLRELPRDDEARPASLGWGQEVAKRAFDLAVAAILLVITFPVMVVLAVAVMVSLRTWRPIFVHERVGRQGRRIKVPKLRTLPVTAPTDTDKYALAAVRTTRLGRALRASHFDELPQLVLVLAGRMSLVGPRPEMPRLASRFDSSFAAARTSLRPGCTGLWQVSVDADKLICEVPH